MRSTLKRTAAGVLVVVAGLLAGAGIANATCVPGSRVCVDPSVPPLSEHRAGPVRDVPNPVGEVELAEMVGTEQISRTADAVGSRVDEVAQGLGSGTGPIPPLPPGIKPVVDKVMAAVDEVAQGLGSGTGPIPPLPPGIKPVVDKTGGGLVSRGEDVAQGLGSGTGPIPPLPPGIKPVVDYVLDQLPG